MFFVAFFDWIACKFEWITKTVGGAVDKVSNIGKDIKDTSSSIVSSIGDGLKTASNWFKFGSSNNSNINYARPNISKPNTQVQQYNQIRVVVNNPSFTIDVQNAIIGAMNTNGADRSLSDGLI